MDSRLKFKRPPNFDVFKTKNWIEADMTSLRNAYVSNKSIKVRLYWNVTYLLQKIS